MRSCTFLSTANRKPRKVPTVYVSFAYHFKLYICLHYIWLSTSLCGTITFGQLFIKHIKPKWPHPQFLHMLICLLPKHTQLHCKRTYSMPHLFLYEHLTETNISLSRPRGIRKYDQYFCQNKNKNVKKYWLKQGKPLNLLMYFLKENCFYFRNIIS